MEWVSFFARWSRLREHRRLIAPFDNFMFRNKSFAAQFLPLWLVITFPALVGPQQPLSPTAELEGDIRQVHDPSIIKDRDTFYVFSTRAGIAIRCSKDLIHWRLCGDVFAHLPEWAVKDVPGLRGLWAPDASYFTGSITFIIPFPRLAAIAPASVSRRIKLSIRRVTSTGGWTREK